MLRFAVLAATLFSLGFMAFAEKPWVVAEAANALEQAGGKSDLAHDVAGGLWFGFAGSAGIGIFLLAFWKLWNRRLGGPKSRRHPQSEFLGATTFWLLLVAAVALGGVVRWNLAQRSLWWDEIWVVKHASLGYQKENPDGSFRFIGRDWNDALWSYRKPTNHPPVSIASKISQSVWRNSNDAAPHEFSEFAVRLPTLLAGLVSIAAIALLLRRWGFSIGAIAAAFVLAMHPWHIRYGTEARAYSFVVLWTILGCIWLTLAISDERGRWRYWMLFGLNQLLLTWSLPNGFWYAGGLTAAAFLVILRQWASPADRFTATARLVVVNALAAMAFLPLYMPNVLQALRWGPINDHALLTWSRFVDALSQLGFGMGIASAPGPEAEGIPSLGAELADFPVVGWAVVLLVVIALVAGAIRLVRNRPGAAIIFAGIVLAAALSLALVYLTGQHFYHRYIIFLIVPFAACFGIGLTGLANGVGGRRFVGVAVALAVLGCYLFITRNQRSLLNSRPYAPFANLAEHLELREREAGALRVIGYGLGGRMLQVYYPETRFAKNRQALADELADAEGAGLPVVVVLGYEQVNRGAPEYGDGFEILDEAGAFHEARAFPGIDPMFYFRVLEKVEG